MATMFNQTGLKFCSLSLFISFSKALKHMYFTYFSFVRYNETIVKSICKRLEESSPTALEEFIKLCVPLFSSDQTFLFETLVNCVSNDPDKLNDAWISMQEANFIPSDGLMLKMAKMFQSHGEEVPFSVDHLVDDQPPFEEIAEKPKKKVTQKELVQTKTKNEKNEEITKNYEDFTTKLAEENLEEVRNILLKVHISVLIHILKWIAFYLQILRFFKL